eukprot:TRINITY_DN19813_c0_g4_i6.p1 TRINITY_DN19813_c0_g4~~TRINITY_DN19813_c0_g4_i6.p1  ORF type:complete len:2296 (-),score=359.04 TRINITY_DN19813_c0_g4_i6:183-6749(-)
MDEKPFGIAEASEAKASGVAGLTAATSRWHLQEGLRIEAPPTAAAASGGALKLLPEAPELRLRLRGAPGSPIEGGSVLRLFFVPLTQWALPQDCLVECSPAATARCPQPVCRTEPTITQPWIGARNVLRVELSKDMTAITSSLMHTLSLSGRHLPIPRGGFLPTRLTADLFPPDSSSMTQPPTDYVVSTGAVPYAPVSGSSLLLLRDGNDRPFSGDVGNELFLRMRLGATMLGSGSGASAPGTRVTIRLPEGFTCSDAGIATAGLRTLSLAALLESSEGRGELGPSGGLWTNAGRTCVYTLASHGAIYAASAIVVKLTVNNPAAPLMAASGANTWSLDVEGRGDLDAPAAPLRLAVHLQGDPDANPELFARSIAVLGRITETTLTPTDSWEAAPRNFARIFFRTEQSTGERVLLLRIRAPLGFGFEKNCRAEDLPEEYYKPRQGPFSGEMDTVLRLGPERRCRSSSTEDSSDLSNHHDVADIFTNEPSVSSSFYAFRIRVLHPRVFDLATIGASSKSFVLETFAGTHARSLDRSLSMPISAATRSDDFSGYGLYSLRGNDAVLQVKLVNMLPYAFTSAPSEITVLIYPGLDTASENNVTKALSTRVSWRVLAPTGYAWDFNEKGFRFRQAEVAGVTADLPISRLPIVRQAPPLNRLNFWGRDETPEGWKPDATYGFKAFVRLPPETPRHSVNEWTVEFGFDRSKLRGRALAASVQAGELRVIHSFHVWSLLSVLQSAPNELMVQFGTVTTIPQGIGSIVLESPSNFAFEAACVPVPPRISYAPYESIPALVDCSATTGRAATAGAGLVRPRVVMRPVDADIPPGKWAFLIACINPTRAADTAGGAVGFIISTFADHEKGTPADLAATNARNDVEVLQPMPFANIVNNVDYRLSGRDDHPGQGSNVVLAFELRSPARPPTGGGNIALRVRAPEGYIFREDCTAAVGNGAFGNGQPYPSPMIPFEQGVRLLSCKGYYQFARMELTRGLLQGRRYAFQIRIGVHPMQTPEQNDWQLSIGTEASTLIPGYRLWAFRDLSLSMLLTSRYNPAAPMENVVDLTFSPATAIDVKGMLLVVAPEGYRIRLGCGVSLRQLPTGTARTITEVPGPVCSGEQPPTNRAQVRFQSQAAVLSAGALYRMTIEVTNPSFVPTDFGKWTLQSYVRIVDEPQWSDLADIGYVASLPITEFFSTFAVRLPATTRFDADSMLLLFEFSVPHEIRRDDILEFKAPAGFDLAAPVADASLEGDLRGCRHYEPAASAAAVLPVPACAGRLLRFRFLQAAPAGGQLLFNAATRWPQVTLAGFENYFTATHARTGALGVRAEAAGLAMLARAVVPKMLDFSIGRVGRRASAVGSIGDFRLDFRPAQEASAVMTSGRVIGPAVAEVVGLAAAVPEISAGGQVLKKVRQADAGSSRIILALRLVAGTFYTLTLRGVQNPEIEGPMLWRVSTYALPPPSEPSTPGAAGNAQRRVAALAPEPHLLDPEEVLRAIEEDANLRDEVADWPTPNVLGKLAVIHAEVESSFFDFVDTSVTFTISITPSDALPGSRLLILAAPGWSLLPKTFASGPSFPAFEDDGLFECAVVDGRRSVYVVRLLERMRGSSPCLQNPAEICINEYGFTIGTKTPETPLDLPRWLRDADKTWLLEVDSNSGRGCGRESDGTSSNASLLLFTNDALFNGFVLKGSLGGLTITPEPLGLRPRLVTTIKVAFQLHSQLKAEGDGTPGIHLRLKGPLGLEFDSACLAVVPDPDYQDCIGRGSTAVLLVWERLFDAGSHSLVVRATNPARAAASNFWVLETYMGLSVEDTFQGSFDSVYHRGRTIGYEVSQSLEAMLRPSTTQRGSSSIVYLWLRPSVYVAPRGTVEFHAPLGYDLSCEPNVVPLSALRGGCSSQLATSGAELDDVHTMVKIQLLPGVALLPNTEYELAFNIKNAASVTSKSSYWGVVLRSPLRVVLEANMALPQYPLTDFHLTALSLASSTTLPYAWNQVRLRIGFERPLSLDVVSEIRVMAPRGWDFRPLCARFEDVTGAPGLPLSNERGHHKCPQAHVMLMYLRPSETLLPGAYSLLIAALNPGTTPTRNLWTVSLLSEAANLGWTPDQQNDVEFADGMRYGQVILAESTLLGFGLGARHVGAAGTPPPLPLPGEMFEVMSGASRRSLQRGRAAAVGMAFGVTLAVMMATSPASRATSMRGSR